MELSVGARSGGSSSQEPIAANSAGRAPMTPAGLTRTSSTSPRKACSFSMSSRMPRSASSHAPANVSSIGATAWGATMPRRPIVMAVFSSSARATSCVGRETIKMRCCRMGGTYGAMPPPILIVISPMAHEALLQTELNSGSRAFVTMPRHSSSTGSSEAWHALARSPNSANADCRTSGVSIRMQVSSRLGSVEPATSGSRLCPRPSASPDSRSRAQTRKSRSGGSASPSGS
mmetsp:Transcript_18282/g.59828  ORF Transcript_18282/g.59828 Transcript_18282/m.59828 type:complete len:232 (-) Transcript_18282:1971-2666(-)